MRKGIPSFALSLYTHISIQTYIIQFDENQRYAPAVGAALAAEPFLAQAGRRGFSSTHQSCRRYLANYKPARSNRGRPR